MINRRNYRIWTGDEVNFIRSNRDKLTVKQIAFHLNSTPAKVQGLINRQSLYKNHKNDVAYPTREILKEVALTGYDYRSLIKAIELVKSLNV